MRVFSPPYRTYPPWVSRPRLAGGGLALYPVLCLAPIQWVVQARSAALLPDSLLGPSRPPCYLGVRDLAEQRPLLPRPRSSRAFRVSAHQPHRVARGRVSRWPCVGGRVPVSAVRRLVPGDGVRAVESWRRRGRDARLCDSSGSLRDASVPSARAARRRSRSSRRAGRPAPT